MSEQYACAHLVDRAAGYGMAGEIVDGNDVVAVRDAVARAATRARSGGGPTLLECKTFRMRGHEEATGNDYVPAEQRAAMRECFDADPVGRVEGLARDE